MLVAAVAMVVASGSTQAAAQGNPEVRLDAVASRTTAIHAGVGLLFPLGTYLRSGVVLGGGIADNAASFRADVVSLFHLDPFRESRWAPYGGGGLSFRHDGGKVGDHTYLLLLIGLEGPRRDHFAPAFEVGLGGGVRAGVILRRARERTR